MSIYFEISALGAMELASAIASSQVHDELVQAAQACGGVNCPDELHSYVAITPRLRARVSKNG